MKILQARQKKKKKNECLTSVREESQVGCVTRVPGRVGTAFLLVTDKFTGSKEQAHLGLQESGRSQRGGMGFLEGALNESEV